MPLPQLQILWRSRIFVSLFSNTFLVNIHKNIRTLVVQCNLQTHSLISSVHIFLHFIAAFSSVVFGVCGAVAVCFSSLLNAYKKREMVPTELSNRATFAFLFIRTFAHIFLFGSLFMHRHTFVQLHTYVGSNNNNRIPRRLIQHTATAAISSSTQQHTFHKAKWRRRIWW